MLVESFISFGSIEIDCNFTASGQGNKKVIISKKLYNISFALGSSCNRSFFSLISYVLSLNECNMNR